MKDYRKTLIGSIIAFVLGTSCCWMSSLAIWLGGAAVLGTIAKYMESTQSLLIIVSSSLAVLSIYLYLRNRKEKPA